MSENSDQIRKNFGEADRARDAGLNTPADVIRQDNIPYGSHPEWNLLEKGGTKKEMEFVNGVKFVTSKFPPAFVMTCPGDFLKNQAKYMTDALNENNVPFCYRYYGNETNPLHHVFHCNIRLEEAAKCNDDECAFFKEFIK